MNNYERLLESGDMLPDVTDSRRDTTVSITRSQAYELRDRLDRQLEMLEDAPAELYSAVDLQMDSIERLFIYIRPDPVPSEDDDFYVCTDDTPGAAAWEPASEKWPTKWHMLADPEHPMWRNLNREIWVRKHVEDFTRGTAYMVDPATHQSITEGIIDHLMHSHERRKSE